MFMYRNVMFIYIKHLYLIHKLPKLEIPITR